MKEGARARIREVDSVCKFLWGKVGTVTQAKRHSGGEPTFDFNGEPLWRLELDELAKRHPEENDHSGMTSVALRADQLELI